MGDQVLAFLNDLDATLAAQAAGPRLDLYHIGGSAVAMRYRSVRVTADVDVIDPNPSPTFEAAVTLFGYDTAKHHEHGLYLQAVNAALPPVPAGFRNRATEFVGGWVVIRLFHLDPHDLICTKLRRYAGKDRDDIRLLCDSVEIDPAALEACLEKAWWHTMEKDGDRDRDQTFANLRRVQAYLRGDAADL